jgi:uncharacterized NAD-dependent epimerase/dehydratase family protein
VELSRINGASEAGGALVLPSPYLLFLGDTTNPSYAKTAFGIRDWAAAKCVGEFRCDGAEVTTGLPSLTPAEAKLKGARSVVIGVANGGGVIPPSWIASLVEALEAGLDIISGMHVRLTDIPELSAAAAREAGAAEMLSPDAPADHWDVIEGQGSLFHPAYAAVSLGLLHGSQPDVFVVCHEPGRTEVLGAPGYVLPSVEETIDLTLRLGRRTNPYIRCGGLAYNTSQFDEVKALALLVSESKRLGLPVADPVRRGEPFHDLIAECLR